MLYFCHGCIALCKSLTTTLYVSQCLSRKDKTIHPIMKYPHLYKQVAGQVMQLDATVMILIILICPGTLAVMMQVSLKKYGKTSPSAFGLTGRKTIAIVRSSGRLPACMLCLT